MSLLPALIGPIADILDKFVEDKDKKNELRYELLTLMDRQAGDIVKEEAKSEHWITSAWRPILMLTITALVGLHYGVFPILNQLGVDIMIELPPELWNLPHNWCGWLRSR